MEVIEKAKIYGVDKVGSSNKLNIVRTDDAVGKTYQVGVTEITSDFSNCYPWSDMHEVTDKDGNVFIKIPKFYTKITKNSDGTFKHQISGVRHSGFNTLFIDGKGNTLDYVMVGKYEASGSSSRIYSKSGATVLVNTNMNTFRSAARANGAGYQQYDYLIHMIVTELFLIEFATTDCQSIMKGYTDGSNTAALATGRCDSVATPSGSELSNTSGTSACKYRGIENFFGNTWKYCDGISFSDENVYLCVDPSGYEAGKITAPYALVGKRPTSEGYLKEVAYLEQYPAVFFPSKVGGSASSYYHDYYYVNVENGQILLVGGSWSSGSYAGLWYLDGFSTAGYAWSTCAGRLCYKPL